MWTSNQRGRGDHVDLRDRQGITFHAISVACNMLSLLWCIFALTLSSVVWSQTPKALDSTFPITQLNSVSHHAFSLPVNLYSPSLLEFETTSSELIFSDFGKPTPALQSRRGNYTLFSQADLQQMNWPSCVKSMLYLFTNLLASVRPNLSCYFHTT